MKPISKEEAKDYVKRVFSKERLVKEEVLKARKLCLKYRIPLKPYKSLFCKNCLTDLRNGSVRVSKNYKAVTCVNCKSISKFRIS